MSGFHTCLHRDVFPHVFSNGHNFVKNRALDLYISANDASGNGQQYKVNNGVHTKLLESYDETPAAAVALC